MCECLQNIFVTIFWIQYFIERGPCRNGREIGLKLLVGEPGFRKTVDQWTTMGNYHSLLPPPPCALHCAQGATRWARPHLQTAAWLLDLKRRAPSVRLVGDQLSLGDAGDLHHQQEVGDHQQGLGEVSK
jgi:hypothetical protein